MAASAQEWVRQGQNAYQGEDYAEALRCFGEAARLYSEAGQALDAAEMANNQSVCHLKNGDAQAALQAALGSEEIFAQAGDVRRQAMALGNQAAAYEALKQNKAALQYYERSAQLLRQSNDAELRALVLKSLSALQMRSGQRFEALATMQIALECQPRLSVRERILRRLLKIMFALLGRGPVLPA